MKLMIIGHKGQLGSELLRQLEKGGSILGKLPKEFTGATVITADIDTLDIKNIADVRRFVGIHKPEIIINCAAYTKVDDCESHPKEAMAANSIGAKNLAVAAQDIGAKLLHISTDYVFDGTAGEDYSEMCLPCPKTIYGKSKWLGEQYVGLFCSRYFIVRTAWLYGRNGGNFVKTIASLTQKQDSISVVNDQWGNPTNAEDLAYHLFLLAVSEEYGIYHCTGKGVTNWYLFAKEIALALGSDVKIIPCDTNDFPRPAKRPAYSALSCFALEMAVGNSMRPWQDAIADYMNEYIQAMK